MTINPAVGKPPRSTARAVLLLVVAAFAVRMMFCALTGTLGRPPDNYREYITAATRLLEQGTFVSPLIFLRTPTGPSALLPPIYGAFVAGVFAVLGVESAAAMLVLHTANAAAGAVAVALIYLVARGVAGPAAGWIAAAVAIINPTLVGFTPFVWDTSWFVLGVSAAVYLSWRLGGTRRGGVAWLTFGVFLGLLACLNPALTIAYPFLVLWPLTRVHGHRFRPILHGVSLTILGWFVAIAPWTVRNYVHFDEVFYIRYGLMLEFWLGACPEADRRHGDVYKDQYPLRNELAQQRISEIGERPFIQECGERAYAAITADPLRYARLTAYRVLDHWFGTVLTHTTTGAGIIPANPWRAAVTVFLALETGLIVIGLIRQRRSRAHAAWLVGCVVAFSVVYCLTHIQIRYRTPMEPILAILIGILWADEVAGRRSYVVPEPGTETE